MHSVLVGSEHKDRRLIDLKHRFRKAEGQKVGAHADKRPKWSAEIHRSMERHGAAHVGATEHHAAAVTTQNRGLALDDVMYPCRLSS
jgi:hypothetical protein